MTIRHDRLALEAVLESAKLLHASRDLEQLLRHLLRSIMGRLLVSRAVLALHEGTAMRVAEVRGLGGVKVGDLLDREKIKSAGIERLLPIGAADDPVGWLGIARPAQGELHEQDHEFLTALLGLAAAAIDNARAHSRAHRLNRELDHKVQQLSTLLDMVGGLTASLDADEVARLLGLTVAGQWLLSRWAVAAWRGGQLTLRQRGMKLSDPAALANELGGSQQTGLPKTMAIVDLPAGGLRDELTAARAEIFVPLLGAETIIGFLALGKRGNGKPYSAADLDFISGLAAQAVVALSNAWNVAEMVEKKKLERELDLAGEIQAGLFPNQLPRLQGFDVAARNLPASQVGGDYYDAIPARFLRGATPVQGDGPDSTYLLCVADVSGKGIVASLIMSNIQAAFRALVGTGCSLQELAVRCNDLIFSTTPGNKFVTAILILVDPASQRCSYLNAGHNDGILRHADGSVQLLKASGTPIGLLAITPPYTEASFDMQPGDVLAIFSDGITEANDIDEQEYGEERLIEYLHRVAERSAEEIVDAIFEEVDRFATGAPQYDDITLMILKRQ